MLSPENSVTLKKLWKMDKRKTKEEADEKHLRAVPLRNRKKSSKELTHDLRNTCSPLVSLNSSTGMLLLPIQ